MAEAARRIDVLSTGPRFTAADVDALNARFADVPTIAMLRAVLREGLAGDVAAVSSFGAESAVLLHLIATIDRSVPVLFHLALINFFEDVQSWSIKEGGMGGGRHFVMPNASFF